MERFFIIDGMAIAYRAYFAFINRPLINSKGMNTSAIFGFVNTLEKILGEEKPDHIAVAFDTPHPTFRHKQYEAYKATREKMPEDMVEQLPYLKSIVQAYNIPVLEIPGWEADDVIGTLVKRAELEDIECFMVTPDKDYMQLVSDRIKMYKPGKAADTWEIVDIDGVREKFGVRPDQVIDVLGLMGDQSDNIPGVKGIGEKTAIPLVQEFGSIAAIYENLENIPKKGVRTKLEEQKAEADLSRELVTIDIHAPVDVDPHELRFSAKNVQALRDLFVELELTRFLQKLEEEQQGSMFAEAEAGMQSAANATHDYVLVRTRDQLAAMVEEIARAGEFCFDTETGGLDPLQSNLVGLSFAVRSAHAWYVPANAELSVEEIVDAVRPLFETGATVIGQNLKFDLLVLRRHGISTAQPIYDTMIAAYILRPEGDHSMDALAMQLLNYRPISISSLIGKGKNQLSMSDIPIEDVAEYAAEDADVTLQLAGVLRSEIAKTGQDRLLADMEFPLVHVLTTMEYHGVKIDTDTLGDISKEMETQVERATSEIHSMAGDAFNINSTKQLGEVLFERLKLPTRKKTKTGYSTDVSVLESLQGMHPIIDEILLYRQLTKLKSTYVDALPRLINPETGRVHTSYNQAVAATGRLSSTDPNLQNIPIRTEAGKEIRRAFVPENDDFVILSADYSQIELRLAAEISGDEGLIEAFEIGEDIHTSTAMRLFDLEADQVTSEQRRRAKTTNFGILYGISAFGLAQRLGIDNGDAKDLIDLYFEKYPRINEYIARTIGFAKENGFVETLLGRRRYIPDINAKNRNIRSFAERTAINAPIQGSAADMIKIAMIRIHDDMRRGFAKSRMIMQVHDELVFEAHRDELTELRAMVVERMSRAMDLRVRIEVDAGTGANWLEAH
ncbi:MAG: DNA polymerase I [Bacteroidetes bacterium]|nr:DNA polymerase I [Bacteroidota bacterium]